MKKNHLPSQIFQVKSLVTPLAFTARQLLHMCGEERAVTCFTALTYSVVCVHSENQKKDLDGLTL